MLVGIPFTSIEQQWPFVEPLLQKAHVYGAGDYSLEDMKRGLLTRKYQLWVWYRDDKIVAACITCIAIYPQHKICCLMMVGGEGLHFWKEEGQQIIIQWARSHGCVALEGYDTRSWLRVLKQFGWRSVWTVIRKEI